MVRDGCHLNRSVEVFKQNLGVGDVEREEPVNVDDGPHDAGRRSLARIGDIHVDSALNEHLAAEIDIVERPRSS